LKTIPTDHRKPFFSDNNNENRYVLKVNTIYVDNKNLKRGKTYQADVSFKNYEFEKGGVVSKGVYVDDVVIKK
jgi:hypothetical protein